MNNSVDLTHFDSFRHTYFTNPHNCSAKCTQIEHMRNTQINYTNHKISSNDHNYILNHNNISHKLTQMAWTPLGTSCLIYVHCQWITRSDYTPYKTLHQRNLMHVFIIQLYLYSGYELTLIGLWGMILWFGSRNFLRCLGLMSLREKAYVMLLYA